MLTTDRLSLRPVEAADRDALHALLALEDVRRYLLDGIEPTRGQIDDVIAASAACFERRDSIAFTPAPTRRTRPRCA